MDPQVLASLVSGCFTLLSAVVVSLTVSTTLARESRLRRRADQRRELFVGALNDAADFVREVKEVNHALGVIAYDVVQRKQDSGMPLVRRVDQAMVVFGRTGWLAPPELRPLRDAVSNKVRELRGVVIGASREQENVLKRVNEVIRELNDSAQAFTLAFEQWKAEQWGDGPTT